MAAVDRSAKNRTSINTIAVLGPLFGLQVGDRVEVLWDFVDSDDGDNYAQVRTRARSQSLRQLDCAPL